MAKTRITNNFRDIWFEEKRQNYNKKEKMALSVLVVLMLIYLGLIGKALLDGPKQTQIREKPVVEWWLDDSERDCEEG